MLPATVLEAGGEERSASVIRAPQGPSKHSPLPSVASAYPGAHVDNSMFTMSESIGVVEEHPKEDDNPKMTIR
jgi:hypothetical protein